MGPSAELAPLGGAAGAMRSSAYSSVLRQLQPPPPQPALGACRRSHVVVTSHQEPHARSSAASVSSRAPAEALGQSARFVAEQQRGLRCATSTNVHRRPRGSPSHIPHAAQQTFDNPFLASQGPWSVSVNPFHQFVRRKRMPRFRFAKVSMEQRSDDPYAKQNELEATSHPRSAEQNKSSPETRPGEPKAPGLAQVDVSSLVYGCAALYVPAAIYGALAFALSFAALQISPPVLRKLVSYPVHVLLSNFQQTMNVHHALLNLALACTLLPDLRNRVPRFARDHLLEANFMATLSLDLFPIFLNFAVLNRPLHFTTIILSGAMATLALYSALNVLRIRSAGYFSQALEKAVNLQDPRDTFEARATTFIWAVVLAILGGCSGKYHYFLFILPLVYLRWQRYRYNQSTGAAA